MEKGKPRKGEGEKRKNKGWGTGKGVKERNASKDESKEEMVAMNHNKERET